VHDEANLITLCRSCHRKIHEGPWELIRSPEGIRVIDRKTGEQVMRRLYNQDFDVSSLFQLLNLTEESMSRLYQTLPYFTDDQLVEAFAYACSLGKRSWLVQAAILYEAQQRSIYGDRTLEAIARRFEISLRQAQKYALVWKVFFAQGHQEENVNVDAILLDEPSWYMVAATETKNPEQWLAYAQDRKLGDPRYSLAAFRQDIHQAHLAQATLDAPIAADEASPPRIGFPSLESPLCPWVKPLCLRSGKPIAPNDCRGCEFLKT